MMFQFNSKFFILFIKFLFFYLPSNEIHLHSFILGRQSCLFMIHNFMSQLLIMFRQIDTRKLINLLFGVLAIYFTFMIGGVLHQYILKQPYINRFNQTETYFTNVQGLIAIQKIVIFLFGFFYNCIFISASKTTKIPPKNSILCALFIFLSSVTNNYAIILVSYPIVIMFKSCNILSVILVGVICSRVKTKALKLQGKKIIAALAVTTGMILFKVFDPQAKQGDEKKVQIFGLILLIISLLADGFLPDFQAQIKERFKPQPTIMMVEINKWCSILSLIYCFVTGNIIPFIEFSWSHPLFVMHLLAMACLAFFGHIFIYKMIKEFRQHIVPFVITTRKIISVGISMIYFKHSSSIIQIVCILVVLLTTLYEFIREMIRPKQQQNNRPVQLLEIIDEDGSLSSENSKNLEDGFKRVHKSSGDSMNLTQSQCNQDIFNTKQCLSEIQHLRSNHKSTIKQMQS